MSLGAAPGQRFGLVDVDLWCIELAPEPGSVDWELLSTDERSRAARFVFERDRDRFVAAHAALRRVLAGYTGAAAAELQLVRDHRGRPSLGEGNAFDFNLSHSGELALIGVTASGPIGVDIEMLRPVADSAALAQRHFSPTESAAFALLPPEQRDRCFLVCWTRKEACLKALGVGLTVATSDFDVGLGSSRQRVAMRWSHPSADLMVVSCEVHRDAVAALAAVGDPQVRTFVRHCSDLR